MEVLSLNKCSYFTMANAKGGSVADLLGRELFLGRPLFTDSSVMPDQL